MSDWKCVVCHTWHDIQTTCRRCGRAKSGPMLKNMLVPAKEGEILFGKNISYPEEYIDKQYSLN